MTAADHESLLAIVSSLRAAASEADVHALVEQLKLVYPEAQHAVRRSQDLRQAYLDALKRVRAGVG